jgi:2-amino-4-hydroxy-6-hydroxymethyldihydropteridine diphosphokinase
VIEACIALGSNLGNRRAHMRGALREMARLGRLRAVSPLYETEPVGMAGQPRFLNAAARLETALGARELLGALLDIEARHGRVRVEKNGPRTLDLDLLFYGGQTTREPGLEVPHPRLHERRFVLAPLAAIAPGWRHPVLGRTVEELLESLADAAGVVLVESADWAADRINP